MLWLTLCLAAPLRAPAEKPAVVVWEPGLRHDLVYVKRAQGFHGQPTLPGATITALFPDARSPDLAAWYAVRVAPWQGADAADSFNAQPWVEVAYLPAEPQPPPVDIPPTTPDFQPQQGWLGEAPLGVGWIEAGNWPGGDGRNVAIADLEYGWDEDHEDLTTTVDMRRVGWDSGLYKFHGTAVWGQLVSPANGYGVTGLCPAAEPVMVFPYVAPDQYDVARAIVDAVAVLEPGDVLLIEQQTVANGGYAPVEAEPAVWDAIAWATESGIAVIQAAGNGGQDLDDPAWNGWFDRSIRDSGAFMVGGGNSPDSGSLVRASAPQSNYGSRIDVQGWFDGIVTAMNGEYNGYYADLYWPEQDGRQAYTSQFGGTSGASPMVAGLAVIFQSVAVELYGEPWDPMDLRALMVSTGTPAQGTRATGPQPDLRKMLRYGMIPG